MVNKLVESNFFTGSAMPLTLGPGTKFLAPLYMLILYDLERSNSAW